MSVCPARADSVTVNAFNNSNNGTTAAVTFINGGGPDTKNLLLSQLNVTYSSGSGAVTINTFTFDLFHDVSQFQTYAVTPRNDLATAFTNGSRIAYIFQTYGLSDLTNDPDQAAAVQLALWDLSLDNHTPTFFALDAGSYDSGDPQVFSVSFGNNPHASQIAALTSQFLTAASGTTMNGAWFDAAGGGANLLRPVVPEPSSSVMTILALGALSVRSLWRRRLG